MSQLPLVCNGCGTTAREDDDTFLVEVAGVTVTCCMCGVALAVEMTADGIAAYLLSRPAVWELVQRLMAVATEPLVAPVVTPDDIERAKRYVGDAELAELRDAELAELRRQSDEFVARATETE